MLDSVCVCVCVWLCVCACGKEASKEQDYLWAIEVAYAFSWRELMHTQASRGNRHRSWRN